jgi:FtsZ-interacting cell division protein YlmF
MDGEPAIVHVTNFASVQVAGDAYRSGRTVELWLDEAPSDVGRRAVDFASGLVYALGGTITKLGSEHFRLDPLRQPPEATGVREPRRPVPASGGGVVRLSALA